MKLEELIENHVKDHKSHGISAVIIDDNGPKFFNYGEIKKDSGIIPTNKTVYEIGSITKTFTAILATNLEQKGRICLDESIVRYLPEFKNSDFDKKNVTLHHLLTHTSGISEFSGKVFASQIFSIMTTGKSQIKEYELPVDEFLKYASSLKLEDGPGTTFRYSNIGFGLVGKILEKITNKSYEELVKTYVCDVIGMQNTGINVSKTPNNELATGYSFKNKQIGYWNVPAIESAGSLRSTTEDMAKFLEIALGRKENPLNSTFTKCIKTKINPKVPISMKFYTKSFGISLSKFRLGWFVFPQDNVELLGLDGGTEGFSSFMLINPLKKLGVVILTNRGLKPVHKLGKSILKEMENPT